MMKNFLYEVCGLSGSFTVENRLQKCVDYIKDKVGSNKVLVSALLESRCVLDLFNC
jgi:GMP synthase (glutamine-hydrolysing)